MRISSRGQYGIRALSVLTARHGGGPVQVREIARAEGLSAKYLEQLLGRLRSGGLVKSVRGARGGYVLAREPKAITVREVLVLLEGSLAPVGCVEDGAHGDLDRCGVHGLWVGLHDAVLVYLGSYTLADLTSTAAATATAPEGARASEPELETAAARG
jgi:Rrf2 family protein